MKLLRLDQIEELAKFKSERFLTTSFFLDTKKRKKTKKEVLLSAKNLMNRARRQLQQMDLDKSRLDSIQKDLKMIQEHCARHLSSYKHSGLAIFSCSGEKFWNEFYLPSSPRNRMVFDINPYVRPLSAILTDYTRICALTFDRKEARWYSIHMGEITTLDHLTGDVPSRVKPGGFLGFDSKRIERHIDSHLQDYLKKIAQTTFDMFQKDRYDWLVLGCGDDYSAEIESRLHPYLKKSYKGRINVSPRDSSAVVLNKTLELKSEVKIQEKEEILKKFITEMKKKGLSVAGLKNTLNKLNKGEVQTLIVTRYYSTPGGVCPQCRFLYVEESECPSCRVPVLPLLDVIDQAVETAFDKNSQVRHITPPSALHQFGDIGALLRYKT